MADLNENIIKKIKLGGTSYDIWAEKVDASAVQFGKDNQLGEGAISTVPVSAITAINETAISSIPENAITAIPASAISATDIPWESISGLAVDKSQMEGADTGIMTPAEIQKAIDDQISTVYKVKGTHTAEVTDGAITNMPPDAKNGDVWNIALPEGTSSALLDGQTITDGDNVVYVEETGKWDKLAGSIDTSTMATKEWVESYVSGGETGEEVRERFNSLWNEVSSYINEDVTSANATALWSDITDAITSGIDTQVWGQTIQTAGELSAVAEDGTARSTSGKYLAGAGAIVDYIKDQIDSTIQETIDIATDPIGEVIADGASGKLVYTKNLALSSIPNVSAVGNFVDGNYIAKKDISYESSSYTLIIENR